MISVPFSCGTINIQSLLQEQPHEKDVLTDPYSKLIFLYPNITTKKYNTTVTFFVAFIQDSQTKYITYRDP